MRPQGEPRPANGTRLQLPLATTFCIPEPFDSLWTAGAASCAAVALVILLGAGLLCCADGDGLRPRGGGAGRNNKSLDALRVILVSYVILYHDRDKFGDLGVALLVGHWPMQFFTVLMGYVNFRVNARYDVISPGQAAAALVRRLGRLCPAYYAGLAWIFGLATVGHAATRPFSAYPLQALFLQSALPLKSCFPLDESWVGASYIHYGANLVGWFTSAAVICALCFPVLFNARPRGGASSVAAALAAVLALRSLSLLVLQRSLPPFGEGPDLYVFVPFRVLEFAAGMLFAQLGEEASPACRDWWAWGAVSDLTLLCAVVVVFLWVKVTGGVDIECGDFMLTGIFGLHALSSGLSQHKNLMGSIDTVLSHSQLSALAQYSYGAFILQTPMRCTLNLTPLGHTSLMPVLQLLCSWVVGAVATEILEGPCSRLVDRRLRRRCGGAKAAAS